MSTDLTKPVIVAHLLIDGVEPSPLLIDGTHRLYWAWREGVPQPPAYLLTAEESRQVQEDQRLGPGRTWRVGPRCPLPPRTSRRAALPAATEAYPPHPLERAHVLPAPWLRLCNCRCPLHHGFARTDYFQPGCACAITCDTQPMTLLAEQRGCALFLDANGDLWHVNAMANGQWDWEHGDEIDTRADTSDDSVHIERLLREVVRVQRWQIR